MATARIPCLFFLFLAGTFAMGSYPKQTIFTPKAMTNQHAIHRDTQNGNETIAETNFKADQHGNQNLNQVVHPRKGGFGGSGSNILRQNPKSHNGGSSLLERPLFFFSGNALWHMTTAFLIL